MSWDPDHYPKFADQRSRPGLYREAYRPGASGITTLAFSRLFIVVRLP